MNSVSNQELYILLFLFSAFLAHGVFPSFLENVVMPLELRLEIKLLGNISIDLFGALIPIAVSFLVVVYLLRSRKIFWKRYLNSLGLAVSFALFVSSVNGAVVIRYQLFDYILAILIFFLFFQERSSRSISLKSIVISKQNYLNSFLAIYSLSSLAVFLVDVIHLPFTYFTMYIGGVGLMDGIFLSGLFSFFTLTAIVALFGILLEERRKMAFPLHRKKYENLRKEVHWLTIVMVFMAVMLYVMFVVIPSLENPRDAMYLGVLLIVLIVVFAVAYAEIRNYVESRKQKKLDRYLARKRSASDYNRSFSEVNMRIFNFLSFSF